MEKLKLFSGQSTLNTWYNALVEIVAITDTKVKISLLLLWFNILAESKKCTVYV